MLRLLLQVVAVLLVCAPLSLVGTFMLLPLWSWLEASYGIETVGHSGPTGWCYVVVYGILNLLVFAALWYRCNAATEHKL